MLRWNSRPLGLMCDRSTPRGGYSIESETQTVRKSLRPLVVVRHGSGPTRLARWPLASAGVACGERLLPCIIKPKRAP
eukprot:6931338-Prymnesium_polylepis.1